MVSIGGNAFDNCSGLSGTLTIPNSVTSINKSAFSHCSGLSGNLTIPNSVTSIGEYAFVGCSGFTGDAIINFQNGITTYIESAAFASDRDQMQISRLVFTHLTGPGSE
jgi:hypothetical protein